MIRIAISGGGLAGASLIHALMQYKHLDVHIFESASAFKEEGFAIGVARNAITALELIGPSAIECLDRAEAVEMRGSRFKVAQGQDQGATVYEINEAPGKRVTSVVQRSEFLRELLAIVPPGRMHASKKLKGVDRASDKGPITLKFTDNTSHECDILVGADGIHSTVRKLILDSEDPAAIPRNTGWWCVMVLVNFEEAQDVMGEEFVDIEDAREYVWIGDGTFLMHNILKQGTLVQLVLASRDENDKNRDQWRKTIKTDTLQQLYKDFPPYLKEAVDELICNKDEHEAFYLWEHLPADSYVRGPMCIMGDAAHATTPWQGAGCGMSFEDSLILSTLLGRARDTDEALIALQVYDEFRLPCTQLVVKSSRATGNVLTGKSGGVGLDAEKLKKWLSGKWDFILNADNKLQRDGAQVRMDILRIQTKNKKYMDMLAAAESERLVAADTQSN
ncbi:salicylate hydroxylase [Nemania sp. FL0916]|nr:salicylate hydroxylase [Nemania sp. FL0916]